jgi:hypothetical protein
MRHRDRQSGRTGARQSFDTPAARYDRLQDLQADPIGAWLLACSRGVEAAPWLDHLTGDRYLSHGQSDVRPREFR